MTFGEILERVDFFDIMKYLVEKKDVFHNCNGLKDEEGKDRAKHIICSYLHLYRQLKEMSSEVGESKAYIKFIPDRRDSKGNMWYEVEGFDPDDPDSPFDLEGYLYPTVLAYQVNADIWDPKGDITLPDDLVAAEIMWKIAFDGFNVLDKQRTNYYASLEEGDELDIEFMKELERKYDESQAKYMALIDSDEGDELLRRLLEEVG